MKRSRIAGLVILIVVIVLLALNFAIVRSSPSLPGGYNNLASNLVRMYHGEIGSGSRETSSRRPSPTGRLRIRFQTFRSKRIPGTSSPMS